MLAVAPLRACFFRILLLASLPIAAVTGAPATAAEATLTSLRPASDGGDCQWREDMFVDASGFLCPGVGAYAVLIRLAGVDSWPVFRRNGRLSDLRAAIVASTGADSLALTGEDMEWRLDRPGGQPRAALFRIRAEHDAGTTTTPYLVARMTPAGACLIGQAADATAARRLADGGAGCR